MSKQMIKRKDGSYSQRGLWDNIRANKGSGKKPTKAMLKQEKKIKAKYELGGEMNSAPVQYPALQSTGSSLQSLASNSLGAPVNTPQQEQPQTAFRKGGSKNKKSEVMKTMYKKAGKAPKKMKESWMEESKEIHFGAPKKKMRAGGKDTDPPKADAESTNTTAGEVAPKPKEEPKEEPKKELGFYDIAMQTAQSSPRGARVALRNARKVEEAKATGTRKGANVGTSLAGAGAALTGAANVVNAAKPSVTVKSEERTGGKRKYFMDGGADDEYTAKAQAYKSTYKTGDGKTLKKNSDGTYSYRAGGKSMKPGGGGRFAAMVNDLKGEGKSEASAAAIAASVGRKKYGKNKFQAMAAAGKKRMGGKKC